MVDVGEKLLLPIAVESLASGQEAFHLIPTSSQLHAIHRVGEALISWPNSTVPASEYQSRPTIMIASIKMRSSSKDERIAALRRPEEEVGILSHSFEGKSLSNVGFLRRSEIW